MVTRVLKWGNSLGIRIPKFLAKELDIELWYSQDEAWLGLQSALEGGRTLRYELI